MQPTPVDNGYSQLQVRSQGARPLQLRGGSRQKYLGGWPRPLSSIFSPLPFPFSSSFPSHHPLLLPPVRSRPLKYSYGVCGSAVSSPSGVPKSNFVHFSLKI